MADVVAQGYGLGQVLVQVEGAGNGAANLGHLQSVGYAGNEVIAGGSDEDLGFVLQPTEGLAVEDSVAIALEFAADGRRCFRPFPSFALKTFRGKGRKE